MAERKKIPVVYAITHTASDTVYIGSTVRKTDRFSHHRWLLRKNEHGNRHLQNSWNKHGEDAFSFGILETVDALEDLVDREQHWIDQTPLKFNIRPFANDNREFRHSEKTKAKMRNRVVSQETRNILAQSWLGKTLTPEHRAKIAASKIGTVMSDEARAKMSASSRRICVQTPTSRAKAANTRAKEYIVTAPTGEEFRIRNMRKFCRENDLAQGNMNHVLRGRSNHHRGWKARHVETAS